MKVTLHSQVHEYRVRGDDGVVQIVRAQWDSIKWHFTVTTKKDPEWHHVDVPTLEMLEKLRDVLMNKYTRRRLPWRFVVDIDKVIEEMKAEEAPR